MVITEVVGYESLSLSVLNGVALSENERGFGLVWTRIRQD
jgi:hypothetical protein